MKLREFVLAVWRCDRCGADATAEHPLLPRGWRVDPSGPLAWVHTCPTCQNPTGPA